MDTIIVIGIMLWIVLWALFSLEEDIFIWWYRYRKDRRDRRNRRKYDKSTKDR